ncbi:MAG: c-type cytochrome [Gammaproteobacteria bacterium]|nr:cytochrome c [Gemmatimonadota bacterium]NIU79558.1 c-type cytochrome [Gammaproteobacteria bacterium]
MGTRLAALGAVLVGIWVIGPDSTGAQNPAQAACPEIDEALTERGRVVFTGRGNCTACHGPNATGGPLAPDLTDSEWLNMDTASYETVATLVRDGVPSPVSHPAPMPPGGGADLSDPEVCAVAAWSATA